MIFFPTNLTSKFFCYANENFHVNCPAHPEYEFACIVSFVSATGSEKKFRDYLCSLIRAKITIERRYLIERNVHGDDKNFRASPSNFGLFDCNTECSIFTLKTKFSRYLNICIVI